MRKFLWPLVVAFIAFTAYVSKPDDRTCIIEAVDHVWGAKVPDKKKRAFHYEDFMNIVSKSVKIDDWIFVKRIRYEFKEETRTVAVGLFKQVITL